MAPASARAFVALLTLASLGGCARSAVHAGTAAAAGAPRENVRFDNEGRERVDVYLVGETRAWRIGRVEPGQSRWLAIPGDIPALDLARLQLVVLVDAEATLDPRRDPRAITTLRRPIGELSAVRWAFWQGQITSVRMEPGRQR